MWGVRAPSQWLSGVAATPDFTHVVLARASRYLPVDFGRDERIEGDAAGIDAGSLPFV